MDTIKILISIKPFECWFSDVLMSEMAAHGFETFIDTEEGFEAYISDQSYDNETLVKLLKSQDERFLLSWKEEKIPGQNWNEVWEKNYFKPLVIGNRVVIRAPFHVSYPKCPIVIVIEPKMAFGTGNHETTSLMIETMLEMDFKNKSVLDMGCGTGILAVLASKLGAKHITAIDIDRWSFVATSENIVINNTLNILPVLGDAIAIGDDQFNILLVNIQKNVILNDIKKYRHALLSGGTVLFSGFFENDLPDVIQAAASNGLKFTSKYIRNNWIVAEFNDIG